jgi:excisionase family DNA binding protein
VVVIKVQQAPAEHAGYRTSRMRRSFAVAGSDTMSEVEDLARTVTGCGSQMRQPKPSEPKHLTASQAAALLQVSPKTVSRWAKEGKLPFVRTLGGHRRYPDSEIRALVDSLSERPAAEGDEGQGTRSA